MPRAPVAGREIRRRSRNGCWNCKARKVKCGEEKPRCSNCERLDEDCDYKIRLSWGGRPLKKKQLENGGNGQDLNADDQSQYIPGAGQFSLNQHFPVAQAFVQATNTNGTARKPPVPRAGSGKKTTMSNYQTVFSVAEPPAPVVLPPATINMSVAAPVDPQLTTPVAPPPQSPTVTRQQQQRMSAFGWQQGLTPTTATTTSHFENEVMYRGDQQQSFYTPYTPVSAPFSPSNHSPNNSFSGINSHSPSGSHSVVTSPHTPYAQTHHSSPQRHQHKNFHPPPPILTSPNKRSRTSTSPIQPPPNSPFIFGVHTGYPASSLTTHATVLGTALDYIENPISGVSMNQIANFHTGNSMRRVSVENLLSTPLRDGDSYPGGSFSDRFPEMEDLKREESPYPMNFGIDNGTPDMDRDDDEDVEDIPRHDPGDYNVEGRVGYGSHLQNYQGRGFYRLNSPPRYPVQISIPRRLDPLPEMLLDNKKNMMYFHHYLHYTARLLVPHDCSENPFKSILPQMAVEKDHLMNLLLAYSASHRARLLEHAEPAERISRFLDETVSKLQISLNHPDEAKSDTTLATAIMLSSYQIISPNTPYDMIGITWQTHLNAARRIILSRGGAKGMHSSNKVSYFLVRWFAYLDLLGSLSGREIDEPLFSGKYWTNDDEDAAEEFTVDCFFGFTNRCVSILAKIGELARKCDIERRLQSDNAARGMIMTTRGMQEQPSDQWTTPLEIVQEATILEQELAQAKDKALGNCSHHHHDNGYPHFRTGVTPDEFDAVELLATNDAFHWAALVHLYRRVLSYPSRHPKVQNAVGQIVGAMHKVRHGGTAENCLLFPLFSAGCEATEHRHREYTLRRMMEVEKSGLTQVRSARELMQRVWKVQRPWWEMADGEFIG